MKSLLAFCLTATFFYQGVYAINSQEEQATRTYPGKKLVESYVAAFNSGEGAMRAFFTENVSAASLEQRPVDARLEIYRRLRQNFSGLALESIKQITNASITALMHTTKDEWILLTFELAPGPPLKLVSLRVEDTEAPGTESVPDMTEKEAISAIAQLLDEKNKIDEFSGNVLIAKDGKTIYKKAYGLASKEFGVRNRIDTKFNLGSINKIFTKIATDQLIQRGKLAFSDPLISHLPDYPNKIAAEKVTIRHLLDMTSGIGDFFGERFDATPKDKFRTITDYLPMFAGDSLQFEPGTQKQYSNGGYIVLGAIIEKVSGQSYYDYVRDHIFRPAGMKNTDSYEADTPVLDLAEGYTRENPREAWKNNIYTRPARGSSAGGGYSTVDDLLKFTTALEKNAFLDGAGVGSDSAAETRAVDDATGRREKPSGRVGMGIFGGAPGINAGIETGVGKGYTIIVMANYDPPAAENVMKRIREFMKGVK